MNLFSRKGSDNGGARHAAEDAGPEEREIRVLGYHLSVTWWQRRLIVQAHTKWQGAVEITPDACTRAEYSRRDVPGGSEWLLTIRLLAGDPSELRGAIEIAIPIEREKALRDLVMRVNAEISTRENAARPSGELLVQTPALPPAAPPPVRHERPPQPAKPEPAADDLLVSTVKALGEARNAPAAEPPPEPRVRNEPPRLRQLTFLQAPDDDEWITFRPLRTADDVRAPVREHG